ncbi:MAG TPA: hypothetical protein VF957_09790, partial [Bradyrhizobium sp.]
MTPVQRDFVNQDLGSGTDPHRVSIGQVECGLLSLSCIPGGTTPHPPSPGGTAPRVRIFCPRQRNIRCDVAAASTIFHRDSKSETIISRTLKYSISHFIDRDPIAHRLCAALNTSGNAADHIKEMASMNIIKPESKARARIRDIGATLFGAALSFAITASALAADIVTLRVGDQKG